MTSLSPLATPRGTAVALPVDLPAPAQPAVAVTFPDTVAVHTTHSLTGVLTNAGDERSVGSVDSADMIPVGSAFLPAVSEAVAQSKAGLLSSNVGIDPDAMLGVFQAHDGSYFISPILASASDEGDMLTLAAGDAITRLSSQLVAVADSTAWADLRTASQARTAAAHVTAS